MLTVDVEAQTGRARESHVDRLIWGQFPEGQAGIGNMMDVGDRHGARFTMFLDWAETDLYSDIGEVGRQINRRGHDVQLHVHTDFFSQEFWKRVGVPRETDLNVLSREQADAIACEIVTRHRDALGVQPVAFRGGGYRFCQPLLEALLDNGVTLDSSVNVSRPTQPMQLPLSGQFQWDYGTLEVPVSNVAKYKNCPRTLDFNFNSNYFITPEAMIDYLECFWQERGADAVAVLVMHSWSLLKLGEDGHFRYDGSANIDRLDRFLALLPKDIEIITAADMVQNRAEFVLEPMERLVNPEATAVGTGAMTQAAVEPPKATATASACTICGTPSSKFVSMKGRQCPECSSVERQRIFAGALEAGLRADLGDLGKVLIVSPSVSEKRIFEGLPHSSLKSVDVRPDAHTDIVADITSMPQIADGSYDTVFASYVMMCVHDMNAALAEIARVLRPNGCFLSIEQVRYGAKTVENTDPAVVQSWYGQQNFEQFKVGSFRILGKDDYRDTLKKWFDISVRENTDPITGLKLPVYLCRKLADERMAIDNSNAEVDLIGQAEALWASPTSEEDRASSIEIYHRLDLEQALPLAAYRLGIAYLDGRLVKKDLQLAHKHLTNPSIGAWRYAKYYLGKLYSDSDFSGFDLSAARKYFQDASTDGVEAAHAALADIDRMEQRSGSHFVCPSCQGEIGLLGPSNENCPKCGSRARQRSIHPILQDHVRPHWSEQKPERRLLAFAPGTPELNILRGAYHDITTASLFGTYGSRHFEGLDIRDMSRLDDASYDDIVGVCIFDFFTEHDKALAECFRVLDDGGVLYTHIAPFRLERGMEQPKYLNIVLKTTDGSDAQIDTSSVGIDWFLAAMQRAGFVSEHITIDDPATGIVSDWFIGHKTAKSSKACSICGTDLVSLNPQNENCPKCGARARTRTLPFVLRSEVLTETSVSQLPALGFSMSGAERRVMNEAFASVCSVSLFGDYASDNISGVDVRDLSRFEPDSFCAVMAILLFDYVPEVVEGLSQIFRVLQPGGVFVTHVAPYRLLDGNEAPRVDGAMQKRPGFFEYVPDGSALPNVVFGKGWFTSAMVEVGFYAKRVTYLDEPTGMAVEWFIGKKAKSGLPVTGPRHEDGAELTSIEFPLPGPASGSGITAPTINLASKVVVSDILPPPDPSLLRHFNTSTVLPKRLGGGRIELYASTPPIPDDLEGAIFAEHVFDRSAGQQTGKVIICGRGFVGLSDDMGETWRKATIPQAEGLRLARSFTTADGFHIFQAQGWQGPDDKELDMSRHGALVLLDPDLNFISRQQLSTGEWHGTASISQRGDTIMFADYQNNSERYKPDFMDRIEEYAPNLRRCGVFRSRNNGSTWQLVFHISPLEARHFHTIQADPFLEKVWWLSSGDTAPESRVWRSDDDGDNWLEVSNPEPEISYAPSLWSSRQKCQRYTDIVIGEDLLVWGADDANGLADPTLDYTVREQDRPGARIYVSPKTSPLQPREIAYIGNHVRKLVDIDHGWLVFTEASIERVGFNPEVYYLSKNMSGVIKIMNIPNYKNRRTSFTTSLGSISNFHGEFFTSRTAYDIFQSNYWNIAKWKIEKFDD